MKFEQLEKKINKLDNDIESLRRAKHYLSNKDEINEIIEILNQERQVYADEIYIGDGIAYIECLEVIKGLLNKELGKDEQIELLEIIKENHKRKSPNVSKKSYGLNAWLKFLDVECTWTEIPHKDWAILIITGFKPRTNQ
ncbi:hypothetical protein [Clostridium saccharobutylicum]|uniref:Uncharacterized protein n=1 Tax=Clostridium saccharobutylicum DSM 13864 TaxID=1345695 RepID=U5MST0_CLOSA|nr:hypothetical protein [Clostridium saccharobutylicum]AGX43578.1 hypothetical protein CLSA_c26070 [Clostridium saccharobutylicum DSM 13864]AQR90876.1 hypothetical protein CLOSC_25970 [Clostridium saccharobutylicum]AQS00780.1 hypothetical protein CSACC_26040 [Clostridium saccharobutylicum]AQS10442.1 hypothetical protein CLOBY_25850 [Clostridium saccharobutylicum]AQS14763.1 hypothetical protein CLOSACC_26040 [Clostridium saccharobutylicum]